jgi:ribose/xylose/arabinose/galactoside ABC-type transport system permease subunit
MLGNSKIFKSITSILSVRGNELSLVFAIIAIIGTTIALDSSRSYIEYPGTSVIDVLRNASLLTIFALGASVIIISGGIDLSAGSMIAFSGTVIACSMLGLQSLGTPESPTPAWLIVSGGIFAGLLAGFLVGSLHAWLIISVGLPPFVATLATLVGLRSLARILGESTTSFLLSAKKSQIPIEQPFYTDFLRENVWIWIATAILLATFTAILLGYTILGRHLYAMGGNEQAALLSGLRTDRLKWFAYVFGSMTASLASVFYLANEGVSAPVTQAVGHELNGIAAAVVGGCSLQGGIGTVSGTLLGALFLRTVIDAVAKIIKTGADVWQGIIVGVVVVLAVTLSQYRSSRAAGRKLFAGPLGLLAISILASLIGFLVATTSGPVFGGVTFLVTACLMLAYRIFESYK